MVMDVDAKGLVGGLRPCRPIRQQGSRAQSCESAKKSPPRTGQRSRMDMVRILAGKHLPLIAQCKVHDVLPVFARKSYPPAVADETAFDSKTVAASVT
jgi:hypothetical protein